MELLPKTDVLAKLKAKVSRFPSQTEAAEKFGVSRAQLCNALADKAPIPPKILAQLGIVRETVYLDTKKLPPKYRDGATRDL